MNGTARTGEPDQPQETSEIARWVLAISGVTIVAISAVVLIGAWGQPTFAESSRLVFNALLPLLGTWVGTVLAYYFSRKNFEAASQSVERMVTLTTEQKLASLAPIVSKALGRTVRFERRSMPRDVVVVRGSYLHSPLWTGAEKGVIELFDVKPPGYAGTPVMRTTPLKDLWPGLQHRLSRRVFDETESPNEKVTWRDYLYTADGEKLLENLAKQTSLRFDREQRVLDVWVMTDGR